MEKKERGGAASFVLKVAEEVKCLESKRNITLKGGGGAYWEFNRMNEKKKFSK